MPCSQSCRKEDSIIAFRDITKVLYDGKIKLVYKDKAHRYYAYPRVNFDLPEDDKKAWGKIIYPKGTTTLLGDTLEKKGLMTWPMGMALKELFGFYDFTNEDGKRMTGFSKDQGTLWSLSEENVKANNEISGTDYKQMLWPATKELLLPYVLSASKNWTRRQKKGADIGSVVHDAIEHYITKKLVNGMAFDIPEQYMWSIKDCEYETEEDRDRALADFEDDVKMAKAAFQQFVLWWELKKPALLGAEDLVYSMEYNVCGTFDGLIKLDGKTVLCDWKTSNASKSEAACMPEGIGYQYFIQSAIYALAWEEMGNDKIDDLLIVSCRKDGGFTTIFASDLGLTVQDCINWAKAVITCYRMAEQTKKGLVAHAKGE